MTDLINLGYLLTQEYLERERWTFYLLTRNNNDMKLKQYYKLYCKILINGVKEAKRSNYNE